MKNILIKATVISGIPIGFIIFINFPDWDISLFGIGSHRFFLTHSAIIPGLFYYFLIFKQSENTISDIFCGFVFSANLAAGIHLLLDILPVQKVTFPLIGSLIKNTYIDDRIWIIVNTVICFFLAFLTAKKVLSVFKHK